VDDGKVVDDVSEVSVGVRIVLKVIFTDFKEIVGLHTIVIYEKRDNFSIKIYQIVIKVETMRKMDPNTRSTIIKTSA
jgi:hypothetical protein